MSERCDEERVSPDAIIQLGFGFMGAKTLLSAVELGLFTELASHGPLDADALGTRLGLHPRGARDFFDTLVALRVLDRADGKYVNTKAAALFLDRHKPTYVGDRLTHANDRLYHFWGSLTLALQTGQPQSEAKHGCGDLFSQLYMDPERLKVFLEAMTGNTLRSAQAIAAKFPWSKYRTFVDIGAAEGALAVGVASAHPHLTGSGFDLAGVRPHFEAYVAAHGMRDRVGFLEGDFFIDRLPQADVLVMGHILHDWNLEQKQALIAKAYDALSPGGVLVIYEAMIDDDRRENAFGLLMSLNMLIETRGGFDFTTADCMGWMRQAGFATVRTDTLIWPESAVVGIK